MRNRLVPIIAAAVLLICCYRKFPPDRPAGVPLDAVWAGGLKAEGRAAQADEIKYSWADRGGMIGLADGRVLQRVDAPSR